MMKTIIKTTNIKIAESITNYINKKAKSLERPMKSFLKTKNSSEENKKGVEFHWEIGSESAEIKKGLFFCKLRLIIPGEKKDIIAHTKENNLHGAIDKAKDVIIKQIVDTKEKPVSKAKRGARKFKRNISVDDAAKEKERKRVLEEGF
jgi:ribosome-associated translation inhibitor RaiA